MSEFDAWYLENLVCPVDQSRLSWTDSELISAAGRRYPVVEGIPVMLLAEREQTIGIATASIRCAQEALSPAGAPDRLYLATLGISDAERVELAQLVAAGTCNIEPVASFMVGATNGVAYKSLIGRLNDYPIPQLRLPPASNSELLLDIGCNWGRWCIAAARLGYAPVGLDPSLGAVLAARRVSRSMGLNIRFVVGNARFLPFRRQLFDRVFSYSVLQHFSKPDCKTSLHEIGRVLKPGGSSLVQMAHNIGLRSFQYQARRKFREPRGFEVRYWTIREMLTAFERNVGPAQTSVDCYFGLGLQRSDARLMPLLPRAAVAISEALRFFSRYIRVLVYVADSIYIHAQRPDKLFCHIDAKSHTNT